MKGIQTNFITSLFLVAVLAGSTSAFAQDASTPPSGLSLDEKTPATAETPSDAAPETTPEGRSSLWESPSPVEKPIPAPVSIKKKEVSAAASEKKAQAASSSPKTEPTPTAATREKKKSVTASLKDMEKQWEDAIPNHDAATVQSFIASDFSGVSSKGKFTSKSSLLADLKKDKDTYTSAKNDKLNVHVYASNVAVVTGSAREKGSTKDGKAFDRIYRFTDTWVDRDGQWQCVGSQVALLSEK
jgi:ketosteroid isomerase-like protein